MREFNDEVRVKPAKCDLFQPEQCPPADEREMDEIEDETDIREQIFHNNVREQIVSAFAPTH